ncbi:DUF6478 family protein [Ruegeria meonggei]|uniref:Uncharacterized protein n=1 Tax=Ruegeria meonggei TaxID=1446476 RepID=A0A1X6Z1X2_9RHOB|nr:DUF6478 family protein [Ruegeria meonggei]SLN38016.1 hypothetical protein RUM8411_01668 [Ruegeria meonggei]
MGRLLDRYIHRKVLERWRKAARDADDAPASDLRQQRDEARKLRSHLDMLLHMAEGRLTRPLIGSEQFPKPLGTDWSWRPDLWRGPLIRPGVASVPRKAVLDRQVTLFHDCKLSEIGMRQIRNTRDSDLAAFALTVEVFGFAGSFLSLSVELPPEAAQGLSKQHLMRVDLLLEAEHALEVFGRLNIQHGPNSDQVLRKLDLSAPSIAIDFDLAHLPLNERRIEKIWLDLIFENPGMNRVVLRDLTFCRHHRADL